MYIFFWVFPRRQIIVGRRFGTLYQFHLQRLGVQAGCTHCTPSLWKWNWYRVLKRRPTIIWRRGNTQKKIYNIQITAKVWNQEKICSSQSPEKYWDDKINEDITALVRASGENMKCTGNFYLHIGTEETTWISGCACR